MLIPVSVGSPPWLPSLSASDHVPDGQSCVRRHLQQQPPLLVCRQVAAKRQLLARLGDERAAGGGGAASLLLPSDARGEEGAWPWHRAQPRSRKRGGMKRGVKQTWQIGTCVQCTPCMESRTCACWPNANLKRLKSAAGGGGGDDLLLPSEARGEGGGMAMAQGTSTTQEKRSHGRRR